jgi:hypothetical protein
MNFDNSHDSCSFDLILLLELGFNRPLFFKTLHTFIFYPWGWEVFAFSNPIKMLNLGPLYPTSFLVANKPMFCLDRCDRNYSCTSWYTVLQSLILELQVHYWLGTDWFAFQIISGNGSPNTLQFHNIHRALQPVIAVSDCHMRSPHFSVV